VIVIMVRGCAQVPSTWTGEREDARARWGQGREWAQLAEEHRAERVLKAPLHVPAPRARGVHRWNAPRPRPESRRLRAASSAAECGRPQHVQHAIGDPGEGGEHRIAAELIDRSSAEAEPLQHH
jgi:hypothetical protein